MAIGATVCKVTLNIVDMDRHYYAEHELTLAQHPSETDRRMMIRLVAFAFHTDERLGFTKGLCAEDEPELWRRNYSDAIELWIELGQPDEKRIRKACGRSESVIVYAYHDKSAREWWRQYESKLKRFKNLRVMFLNVDGIDAMAARSMALQCHICDGEMTFHDGHDRSVTVTRERWL